MNPFQPPMQESLFTVVRKYLEGQAAQHSCRRR